MVAPEFQELDAHVTELNVRGPLTSNRKEVSEIFLSLQIPVGLETMSILLIALI